MLFSSSVILPSQKKEPGDVKQKEDSIKIDRLIKAIPVITLFRISSFTSKFLIKIFEDANHKIKV